jgi:hypothetical protein
MRATTVKVDGKLLEELERAKPVDETLSGYVRSILEREMRRRQLADAAEQYVQLLRDAPDERAWLDEWDAADLARPPAGKRK